MHPKEKEKGTLALFEYPEDLVASIQKVRKLKISKLEAYTPFPSHEVHEALGLKRSWIPWGTLVLGLSGLCLGFLFQIWTMMIDGSGGRPLDIFGQVIKRWSWYLNVGGKPLFSWPAFVPVTFESMVLIGGVSTVVILVALFIIPQFLRPVLDPRLTDNLFGLYIDQSDPHFNESELHQVFKEFHAKEVKNV